VAAGVLGDLDGAAAGKVQHPQCFPMATLAWAGELVTGQRFPAGADGVQRVALGSAAAASLGSVDLDHPFAMGEQEAGQARAVAAGALQRPAATTRSVLAGDRQQLLVAGLAAWDLQLRQQPAVGVQDRRGVAVAVGVDADDGIDVAF